MKNLVVAILALGIVVSFSSRGEDQILWKPDNRIYKSNQKKIHRKLASLAPEVRASATPTTNKERVFMTGPAQKETELRLSIQGGVTGLAFGATADIRHKKYLGLEADTMKIFPTSAKMGEPNESLDQTLAQTATMVAVKGQYPFKLANATWTPRLGLGYGFISADILSTETGATSSETSTVSLSGPYATVGLDVEISRGIVLSLDYSHSISASGQGSSSLDGTTSNFPGLSGSFSRLRVGAYYRLMPKVLVGGQLASRNVRATSKIATESSSSAQLFSFSSSSSINASQTQLLGVVMIQL